MLARHRQSLILQAVRSDGSARVSDLTQQLGVSDMTVRRDLEALARDGLIEKVHGGAVLPGTPTSSHEPGFEAKLVLEQPEKAAIGRAAASLVKPGTAIALSAGTTTFALAQCLLDVPGLTIVTNSLRVMNLFSSARPTNGSHTSVILTGGIRTPSDAVMAMIIDPNNGLFPHPNEISMECSCPDGVGMCKHTAAVLYGIGACLDLQPEWLFIKHCGK